ncbi:MAG: NAD(P)H-binding protein [Candidatus Tectimicrobiota bacterium]
MDIVITGANGAVGTALLRHLRQSSGKTRLRLRALVRSAAGAATLQKLGVEIQVVDYQQPALLRSAMAGTEALVHLAGALIPRRGETLQQANVETTRALVEAATATGVTTCVYLSFPGADPASQNDYLRTKGLAEASLQQASFAGAIFRVPLLLGPDSPALLQLCRMARAPFLPLVSGGAVRLQPLAQADVLAAIVRVLSAPPRPLRVLDLVGPETLTYATLLHQVCARLGTRPRILPIPGGAVRLSARVAGALLPVLAWNPSLYEILFCEHLADSTAACNALGLTLTPVSATLDQALSTPD